MTELKEFRLPDVGEGLTEADIVSWHVKPGDQVEVNQIIVEIETAKAVVELPSPWDGTVARLLAEEGQTVDVGTPIIAVDVSGAAAAPATAGAVASSPQGGSGGDGGTESPPVSGGGLGGVVPPVTTAYAGWLSRFGTRISGSGWNAAAPSWSPPWRTSCARP